MPKVGQTKRILGIFGTLTFLIACTSERHIDKYRFEERTVDEIASAMVSYSLQNGGRLPTNWAELRLVIDLTSANRILYEIGAGVIESNYVFQGKANINALSTGAVVFVRVRPIQRLVNSRSVLGRYGIVCFNGIPRLRSEWIAELNVDSRVDLENWEVDQSAVELACERLESLILKDEAAASNAEIEASFIREQESEQLSRAMIVGAVGVSILLSLIWVSKRLLRS